MKHLRLPRSFQVIADKGPESTIWLGFANWFRVQRALVLRELMARFSGTSAGYVWLFAEPALMVIALSIVFSVRGKTIAGDMELPVFILTGFGPFLLWRKTMTMVMKSVRANKGLLNYRRVRPLDGMFARMFLEFFLFYFVFFSLAGVIIWMGYSMPFNAPEHVLFAPFCLSIMAFGLGALFSIPLHLSQDFEQVTGFLGRFFFLASGVVFTVDRMPEEVRPWILWNPVLHAIELMREGFFGGHHVSHGDPAYLAISSVLIFALGLSAAFTFRRRYYFDN